MLLWNKCGLDNLLSNFANLQFMSIYCTGPEWGGVETCILCTILLILASCHPVNFNHLRAQMQGVYKDDGASSVGIRQSLKLPPKFQDALFSNTLFFFRRPLRSTSHGCVFPFWVRRWRPEGRSRHARRWALRSSVRAKVWRIASCGRKCQTCRRLWVRNIL